MDEIELLDPKPEVWGSVLFWIIDFRSDMASTTVNLSCEEQYFVKLTDEALLTAIDPLIPIPSKTS